MEDKKLILGLDVSTKTIGISLFEDRGDKGKLLFLKHVTPKVKPKPLSKMEELVRKVEIFETEFLKLYQNFNITKVVIEEPLLRSNNINTVGTLLKFNGMISMSVYRILQVVPEFISSYDARAFGFPELMEIRTHKKDGTPYPESHIKRAKPTLFGGHPTDVDKKLVVWEKVADLEPQIVWDYTKKKTLAKENFDMTDAYAAVLGFMRKIGSWK
jgi:Holliday junction resolvasome RuvABC endonuclease subunit